MPLRLLLTLVLALLPCVASALEVLEARWGFDGTVVPGRVNPLSLLVRNDQAGAMDGALTLRCGRLVAEGAPWVTPVFLAPGTARWVQFYPLVEDELNFVVAWSGGGAPIPLPEPRRSAPATVLLTRSVSAASAVGGFRQFPDELFPITVAATEALDAVVLDHEPRWQPAQRRAFRDWLARGGTLHMLRGPVGEEWALSGDLADLDRPEREYRVEAGRVLRSDCARRDFTPERAAAAGHAPRTLKEDAQERRHASLTAAVRAIASDLRPRHNWGAIYTVLIAFIACMGPLPWLLVRLGMPSRWAHALMLASVLLSTWLLATIGRRGYGERAAVHSLAIARSLGDGAWDVRQWANAFVTGSDTYAFAHRGQPNLYAASGDEGAESMISTADGGRLFARIPLYSSRSFEHRARLDGPRIAIGVSRNDGNWKADSLELRLSGAPKIQAAALLRGWRVYELRIDGDRLTLADDGQPVEKWCEASLMVGSAYASPWQRSGDREAAFAVQFKPLVAEAVGEADGNGTWIAPTHPVSVFLYAEQPRAFQLAGEGFAQYGRVLYRVELALDDTAPAPGEHP